MSYLCVFNPEAQGSLFKVALYPAFTRVSSLYSVLVPKVTTRNRLLSPTLTSLRRRRTTLVELFAIFQVRK